MSFFWLWDGVHGGATVSLQRTFLHSPPDYDIGRSFFIVNYCQIFLFTLFNVDAFLIIFLT